jgi:hypothetical protein
VLTRTLSGRGVLCVDAVDAAFAGLLWKQFAGDQPGK